MGLLESLAEEILVSPPPPTPSPFFLPYVTHNHVELQTLTLDVT